MPSQQPINAVQVVQMPQLTTITHGTVSVLTAYWIAGSATNFNDPMTFTSLGTVQTSTVNDSTLTPKTLAGLYARLVAAIQTASGLTFLRNGGSAILFDAFPENL